MLQYNLFAAGEPNVDPHASFSRLRLDDRSWVDVARHFLRGADTLFEGLRAGIDWVQYRRHMYDRMVDDPRLSHWYGGEEPMPHPVLASVRDDLAARYGVPFAGVGLNYYRDGRDSVAYHGDTTARDLPQALVATLSLGSPRRFLLRPTAGGRSLAFELGNGDLFVMGGTSQRTWRHGIPKVAKAGPRIAVMFRPVFSAA